MVNFLFFAGLIVVQAALALLLLAFIQGKLARAKDQVYKEISDQVNSWVLPAKEGEPSYLGQLAGQLGDIIAERIFIRMKMSLQGERSGASRREKADQPGIPGLDGLMNNPGLAFLAKLLPGLSPQQGPVDNPGENHKDFGSQLSKWR